MIFKQVYLRHSTGATTSGQYKPDNDGNERVLDTSQIF